MLESSGSHRHAFYVHLPPLQCSEGGGEIFRLDAGAGSLSCIPTVEEDAPTPGLQAA